VIQILSINLLKNLNVEIDQIIKLIRLWSKTQC